MMGAAVIAALSMSVTLLPHVMEDTTHPVEMTPPPAPAPPPPRARPQPQRDPLVQEGTLQPTQNQPVAAEAPVGETLRAPALELITRPHWLRRPDNLEIYYPRNARRRDIEGQAVLDCVVSTAGELDCAIVSETPERWGFGAAALAIARDHRMSPAMRDGVAVEGRYRMRVPFELN
jgi:TonB family protein